MLRPTDDEWIYLKTVFESDGFVPDAYGRSVSQYMHRCGYIVPMSLPQNEWGTYWTVRENSRSLTTSGNRNHYQNKNRSYPAVRHGWRLTKEAERATLTLAVTAHNHRNIRPIRNGEWVFPRFTHMWEIKWTDVEVQPGSIDLPEVREWCFENDVALSDRWTKVSGYGKPRTNYIAVEDDRAVEFRLRFG